MAELSPLDFFLVVLKPVTVFTGLVNGAPADPYVSITWNNGATGTTSSIGTSGAPVEGNSVFFGTSAGGRERGVTRLRGWSPSDGSGTAGTMTIAETSDLGPNIADGDNITVKLTWQLWDKVPRQDASNPSNIIFYEDYNVAYNQQTVNWKPVAVAGPPAVEFLDAGQVTVDFVGDRSFALAPGATLSSYLWTAHGSSEGTSSSQGTEASPVTFTWTAAGQYLVSLKVTDSNGIEHTNYTWVFVIDPANATNVAYKGFDAISDTFDAFQGGGSCNFTVNGTADTTEFPAESLVLHVARGNQTTPTATWPNRSNLLYAGYITGDSIKQDPISNTVSFRTVSIDGLMKKLAIYPVRLEDSSNPQNWTQAKDLTVDRVLSYLAHWRSTLSLMTSIRPLNYDAELKSQDFNASTLWGMFKALMGDAWGLPISDHQSVLHLVRDYNLQTTSERATATTRKTLQKGVWVGNVDIAERQEYEQPVRKVKWNGVYYPGGDAAAIPLFSEAPGNVMDSWGNETARSGFILTTQSDLNTRTGYAYARANYQYPNVTMRFLSDGSFTIAPQEIFPANVEAADNNRGLTWTPDLIPRNIRRTYNHQGGYIDIQVTFEPSITGAAGATISMPAKPASATGGGVAPVNDPPPAPPVWTQPTVPIPGPAVGADTTDGCYITFNSGASWEERNNLLTVPQRAMEYLIWDPWWFTPDKQNTNDPEQVILWACGLGFVAKSDDAGKHWQDLSPNIGDPPNVADDSPAPTFSDVTIKRVHGDIHTKDEFFFIVEWENASNVWRGWILKTTDDGTNWTWEGIEPIGTAGEWVIAPNGFKGVFSASGGPLGTGVVDQDGASFTISSVQREGSSNHVVGLMIAGYNDGDNKPTFIDSTVTLESVVPNISSPTNVRDRDNDCGNTIIFNAASTEPGNMPETLNDNLAFLYVLVGAFDFTLSIDTPPDRCSGSAAGERPLETDVDLEDGSRIWVTKWTESEFPGDTALYLQKYDTSLVVQDAIQIMLTVTMAEVDARTYYISPYCPPFFETSGFGSIVYVYGRWDDGTVKHLSKSTDEGSSFTDIGDSGTWGTGWVGAFFADDTNTLYAFVNGGSRALYRSLDGGSSWTNLSSLPFDVDPGGVSKHPDGRILISNRDAGGSQSAAYAIGPDYSSWVDATGSPAFPSVPASSGGSNAIIWIT